MTSLKKNFAYQTMYQILILLLPLVTAPYIARVLGKENSGIFAYYNTMATYFVVFGNLGIEQYGNRSIARVRDDKNQLSEAFSELFAFHMLSSFISILAYVVFVVFFPGQSRTIAIIEMMYVVSTMFDVNWFFFGLEKYKITVIRNTIIKIISVICIFVFVKSRNDTAIYTAIMAGSILLSQLSLLPILKKYVSFKNVKLINLKKHLLPMLLLFVAVIAANLNRVIDKAMLGWFDFIPELGCYDYADRIIRMPLGLIAAIGTIMLSKMSNLYARDNKESIKKILNVSEIIIIIVAFASAFGLAAVSEDFIALYLGEEYTETAILIPILTFSIPLVGWNNFVRTQVLIPQQKDSIYTMAVLIGAGVNIVVNVFAIRFWGAYGAAVATVVSYTVITFIQTYHSKKDLDLKEVAKFIPIQLLIGLIMYALVRCVSMLNLNMILKLVLELLTGGLIYTILTTIYLKITHPEILNVVFKMKPGKK